MKTYNKITMRIIPFLLGFLPTAVFAAPSSFKELVGIFLGLLDQGTAILIGIAALIFFWNITSNLWGEESADKNKKLRSSITWGILILFIMSSIWGILYVLQQTLIRGFGT